MFIKYVRLNMASKDVRPNSIWRCKMDARLPATRAKELLLEMKMEAKRQSVYKKHDSLKVAITKNHSASKSSAFTAR